MVSETGIPAGGQISIPFSASSGSTFALYTIADALTVSPPYANLVAGQPVPIKVATLSGVIVPFTYSLDQPSWVSIGTTGGSTPATFTVTLIRQSSYSVDYVTLTITPTNSSYPAKTVRLYITAPVQITSNVYGGQVSIDGGMTYYPLPYAQAVRLGAQLNLNLQPPRTAGYQYSFSIWSDNQPQQHSVMVSGPVNLTVTYSELDQLVALVSPAGAGSVTITPAPVNGFVPHNSTVQVKVTASSNYYFSSFGGAAAALPPASPTSFQVTGPTTFMVNFTADPNVTLSTNIPANESYTVTLGSNTGAAPQSAQFPPSSQASLIVPIIVNSVNPGVRYQFQQWSDGVTTNARVAFLGASDAAFQAIYAIQVNIGTSVAPAGAGTVSGGGWVNVQSNVSLNAQASSGYAFTSFAYNGNISTSNPLTFTAQTPLVATANFAAAASISIQSTVPGLSFTADNVSYQTPATFEWLVNTQHTLAFGAIINGPTGVRYQFSNWQDSNDPYVRTITVGSSNTTFTAAFTTEYLITATPSPANGGTVSGGGWYDSGSLASVQAYAAPNFTFSGFSGDLTGTTNPSNFNVAKPLNIVANFAPGGPVLNAAPNGAASDSNGLRIVPLNLQNTGRGPALGAQIDSITNITVLSGTGPVTAQAGPFPSGDIAAGSSGAGSISLAWPSTATRVRMTVNFSANGGAYHGSTTLNLFR